MRLTSDYLVYTTLNVTGTGVARGAWGTRPPMGLEKKFHKRFSCALWTNIRLVILNANVST